MAARHVALAVCALLWPAAALADDQICPDRPSKSTGECTVPAGRWQLETGVGWSHDRSDGVSSDLFVIAPTLIKYGISGRADVELGVTAFQILRESSDGSHRTWSGIGDTNVRLKYKLTSDDAPILVGIEPFVSFPTANRHLGSGKVEGGVLLPMSTQLTKGGVALSVDPEIDLLSDSDGRGRHVAMVQVANVGVPLTKKLTVSGEVWGQWEWDPSGTTAQKSADAAVAYIVNNDLQLDAGANFGLNHETAAVEVYAGVSVRFR